MKKKGATQPPTAHEAVHERTKKDQRPKKTSTRGQPRQQQRTPEAGTASSTQNAGGKKLGKKKKTGISMHLIRWQWT